MKSVPTRVAVVCDYALSYLGGAQTALLQQAAALADAGAEVVIVSPSSAEAWERVRPDSRVDHVSVAARWTLPGLDLPVHTNAERLRHRLEMIMTSRRVEVVHLQSEFGLAAAAIKVAEKLRIPVIHTVHTFFWQAPDQAQPLVAGMVRRFHHRVTGIAPTSVRLADRPADSALRNMTLAVARKADLVISPSAHQADRLRTAGLDAVAVIPNTVTTPDTGLDAQPLTAVEPPLKIIWVGRCVPEKRILTFVGAAVQATERLEPGMIDFTVVGDGSQLEEAKQLAADCPAVRFLGRQDHDRVAELLAESHLLALTSRGFDNQPMTVVEAVMALRGVIYCDPVLSEGLAGPGIASPASEEALRDVFVDVARHPERVVDASLAAQSARKVFAPAEHAAVVLGHYRDLINARTR
jgi:glycosyltransferase involved in cell wall biosynthesis